jgi:CheY-like chemotaxis protein
MCIRMPVIDGIMATSEIRARHPDAKIVVITVGAEGQQLTQLNKAGAATVLLKPITFDELIPALLKVASAPPSEAAPTDAA